MPTKNYGLHWFRRDLRVTGNPALQVNWKKNGGRVIGVFYFDKAFLGRPDFSPNRFQFFLQTLEALQSELRELGSDLLFMDTGPFEALPLLLKELSAKGVAPPNLYTWNRDYESYAIQRDQRMQSWLNKNGIEFHTERDHLLIEPQELYKADNPENGYQVFTPFSKKWKELFGTLEVQSRISLQANALRKPKTRSEKRELFSLVWKDLGINQNHLLSQYQKENAPKVSIPLPKVGLMAALKQIQPFSEQIENYSLHRDIPGRSGTSRMSPYLKNGSLTTAQLIAQLKLIPDKGNRHTGMGKYLTELMWREFYYHILARHPYVEDSAFQTRFDSIEWENNDDWFEAWKNGMTGFPIVDAGMRQLKQTGWMHNRVRMIVASFLTKDLLVDWRWGARYFMEQLLDGDLAPNNGGWQWAASTGCDPQPYFRIFNPWLQSQKFDPEGLYIRRYIPELAHLDSKSIHAPATIERRGYPTPIVDHGERRLIALQIYGRKAKR